MEFTDPLAGSLNETTAIITEMDALIEKLSASRPVRFTKRFVSVSRGSGGGPWCLWNERVSRPLRDSPVSDRLEFLKFSAEFFREYLLHRQAFPMAVDVARTEGAAALKLLREASQS